jgi:hypothetical protein
MVLATFLPLNGADGVLIRGSVGSAIAVSLELLLQVERLLLALLFANLFFEIRSP